MKPLTIAMWFSCGAASAVAAKLTLERYIEIADVRVLNTPVAEEDADNRRFLRDVEQWLAHPVEEVTNPKWPTASASDVWAQRRYMSGVAGAPCTLELKKGARYHWERENHADFHVLGFTADEKARHDRFVLTERDNVLPVLIEAGMTKADCAAYLQREGLRLPRVYEMGYPNANCIGCVKATSPTYWNHVRRHHPAVFAERAMQSAELGVTLVRYKGKRIPLLDLPADAKGRPLRGMKFECGIFCEEYSE